MLRRGYVIAATDYPGLGTEGIHPYLIGDSEAYSVLDSVRAARELPDAKAQKRFAVWGHSQGGHAALFTGQLAASYAPDLELVGVAAAAPATYLAELFEADRHTQSGLTLTSMALLSWSKLYHLPTQDIVDTGALAAYERVASDCLENLSQMLRLAQDARPLDAGVSSRPIRHASLNGVRSWIAIRPGRCRQVRRCSSPRAPPTRQFLRPSHDDLPSICAKRVLR